MYVFFYVLFLPFVLSMSPRPHYLSQLLLFRFLVKTTYQMCIASVCLPVKSDLVTVAQKQGIEETHDIEEGHAGFQLELFEHLCVYERRRQMDVAVLHRAVHIGYLYQT